MDTLAEAKTSQGDNMDTSAEAKTLQGDTSETAEPKTSQEDTSESSDDDGYVSDSTNGDSDVMFVGISVPAKPVATIVSKVQRSRSYKCYLCGFVSELQVTFVKHFTTKHPGQSFKCDFCDGLFQTCNGLFKQERSHQYM